MSWPEAVAARVTVVSVGPSGEIVTVATAETRMSIFATISFALTFASQAIERYFFFTAVVAPRMPGGVAA